MRWCTNPTAAVSADPSHTPFYTHLLVGIQSCLYKIISAAQWLKFVRNSQRISWGTISLIQYLWYIVHICNFISLSKSLTCRMVGFSSSEWNMSCRLLLDSVWTLFWVFRCKGISVIQLSPALSVSHVRLAHRFCGRVASQTLQRSTGAKKEASMVVHSEQEVKGNIQLSKCSKEHKSSSGSN